MNLNELPLEHALLTDRNIAIKLVGVGGAGSNAVDRLKMENLERLQLADIGAMAPAIATEKRAEALAYHRLLAERGAS